jgi:hypothetical protein
MLEIESQTSKIRNGDLPAGRIAFGDRVFIFEF